MPSPSVEDYIKAIYKAHAENGNVATQELAGRLSVSAPAVSKMLRRLTELRLISHTPYQGVQLTRAGEKMALEIIRHHRLIELYLVQAMGYSWDSVHEEADRLEHHISEAFEDRIDQLLGHPTTCPHGDPIPTRAGTIAKTSYRSLAHQRSPEHLVVRRVQDEDAELLRHLQTVGITPGTAIEFVTQEPFEGALVLNVGGKLVQLTPHAAKHIFVDPMSAGDDGSDA
ncbi:MAG TPA: metal-dependent transcriptional regulator [Gemmatimonadaceae bacterium]|jgi:DtxR family Mn-dependent transcriptional regulator|nr:metal-dependent transcriptional regulator [Gemmatimonadaceae bacterium]